MNAKKAAAEKAVTFVKEGMTVGLGTGSTAAFAIEAIGKRVSQGLSINAVASSRRSEKLAQDVCITLVSFSAVKEIDLYIDGADAVDKNYNLVKGGGGALLREKILAYNSKAFIVIVDESKLVSRLGSFPLPVEITPFAMELTIRHLRELDCLPVIRQANGETFVTDNGNHIVDCKFEEIEDVMDLMRRLKEIPGVVEHGLFSHKMVARLVVGREDEMVDVTDVNASFS